MLYTKNSPFQWDMSNSTPLPNIHPEDIDCVIRSQNPSKGSLYVSNLEGAENILTLKKLKISSIVTCAAGYKLDHPTQMIRFYKYIPFDRTQTYGSSEYFDQAADFIQGALLKSNVMVHCLTGCGRAIVILIAFLIKHNFMNYADAYQYLQKKRKFISFAKGYEIGLKQFYNNYQQKSRNIENSRRIVTGHENLKTLKFLDKGASNSIDKGSKMYSFYDKNDQSRNHQQNKSQKDPTNNNQFSRDLIHESINNSYNKKIKRQNNSIMKKSTDSLEHSKISQNQRINSSASHIEPKRFENILSSSHNQYLGVKRNLKNSSMSQQKQKISSSLKINVEDTSHKQSSMNHLKSSNISNYNKSSQVKSLRNSNINKKMVTQKSECFSNRSYSSSIKINAHNPEDCLNPRQTKPDNQRSQSKVQYFKKINNKISDNISFILTEYETESRNIRQKYHHKLRHLRLNQESLNIQGIF